MPKQNSTGTCRACKGRFSVLAIGRHLRSCPKRKVGRAQAFYLKIHAGPYWLYAEATAAATLVDLDGLLRRTWLECCGHMSAYEICGTRYERRGGVDFDPGFAMIGDRSPRSMSVQLGQVLRPELKFTYEYDFGSTTGLELKVISAHQSALSGRKIQVIARNNPPEYRCSNCKGLASTPSDVICAECGTLVCKSCARKHECEEDFRMPLVNSPRAGVCGYTG